MYLTYSHLGVFCGQPRHCSCTNQAHSLSELQCTI